MSISSRCIAAAILCFAVSTQAQAQKQAQSNTRTSAAKSSTTVRTATARTMSSQGETSPLPAPDIEFVSPVIVPARSVTAVQIVPKSNVVEGDLTEFLSGKLVPLDIKLSAMKSGWQSLRVMRADEKAQSPSESAAEAGTMRDEDFFQQLIMRFGSENNRYFTQGKTLRINNDTQLVVYRSQFPNQQAINRYFEARIPKTNPPQFDTALILRLMREFLDTIPVRASLVNTRNISALEEVSAFNFDTQFAGFSEMLNTELLRSEAERKKQLANSKSPEAIAGNLRQLFEAVNQYTQDYDDKLPPLQNLTAARKAVDPYLRNQNAWMDSLKIGLHPNALLSGKSLPQLKPYAGAMILFYSDADSQGERWVLRLDGQVRQVNAAQWPKLKAGARIP